MESSEPQKDQAQGQTDSWYGVVDPRKRKQIQNRLAQRARRKRLSAAAKSSGQTPVAQRSQTESALMPVKPETSDSNPSNQLTGPNSSSLSLSSPGPTSSSSFSGGPSPASLSSASSSTTSSIPYDQLFLHDTKMSAIMAVWINGNILGIACKASTLVKSQPQPLTVPTTLYPTPLQLSTPHYDWIDRLPFPRMRDNMILLLDLVAVEQFLLDFFTMQSFTVKADAASWDPGAWQMSEEFHKKWGYLLY